MSRDNCKIRDSPRPRDPRLKIREFVAKSSELRDGKKHTIGSKFSGTYDTTEFPFAAPAPGSGLVLWING